MKAKLKEILLTFYSLCRLFINSLSKKETYNDFKKNKVSLNNSIIVIGNGPSFANTFINHLDFFSGKDSICVNDFALSDYFVVIKPQFYIFKDPVYLNNQISESNKQLCDKLKIVLIEKVDWKIVLLFPSNSKDEHFCVDIPNLNSNVIIEYYNTNVFEGYEKLSFWLYKKWLAVYHFQNVMGAAIFLLINIGYKTIFISGADHSWFENLYVNNENVLHLKNTHFYENEKQIELTPFYKDIIQSKTFTMTEILNAFLQMFKGYDLLRKYSAYFGCKIYNISNKSFIDSFERLDLNMERDEINS